MAMTWRFQPFYEIINMEQVGINSAYSALNTGASGGAKKKGEL